MIPLRTRICQKNGKFLRLAKAKAPARSLSMMGPVFAPKRSEKKDCTVGCERKAMVPPTTVSAPATAGNRVAADMVDKRGIGAGCRWEEWVIREVYSSVPASSSPRTPSKKIYKNKSVKEEWILHLEHFDATCM